MSDELDTDIGMALFLGVVAAALVIGLFAYKVFNEHLLLRAAGQQVAQERVAVSFEKLVARARLVKRASVAQPPPSPRESGEFIEAVEAMRREQADACVAGVPMPNKRETCGAMTQEELRDAVHRLLRGPSS